jgi:hypothetical protein
MGPAWGKGRRVLPRSGDGGGFAPHGDCFRWTVGEGGRPHVEVEHRYNIFLVSGNTFPSVGEDLSRSENRNTCV